MPVGIESAPEDSKARKTVTSTAAKSLTEHFYPEVKIGGFANVDGTLAFYSHIAAVLKPTDHVLEFGAGRGANILENSSDYVRALQVFKGRCAQISGCDIDPIVLENPFMEEARVIQPGQPLPYPDAAFDLIVSNWVFEHIDQPAPVIDELLRILKPGGMICACTPNKYGYISLAARLVKNSAHDSILKKVQPGRKAHDVFPTRYRLNTIRDLRRIFGDRVELVIGRTSAEPAYHFGISLVYRFFRLLHRVTPDFFATTLHIYARKHHA